MKLCPNERRIAKLEMQSVPSVRMAEARRPPVRQVAIRVEDVDEQKEQHGIEHYFMRLIWV